MSPEKEIAQLFVAAIINPKFQKSLVNKESRRGALDRLRTGQIRGVYVPITDDEMEALCNIDAKDLPTLAKHCVDYNKLMGR